MLSHEKVWEAIDAIAARYSLTPSGLAKLAGLDSTAFNRSKRYSTDGRPRWPSTESLAKVFGATGASWGEFIGLMEDAPEYTAPFMIANENTVPMIDLHLADHEGVFTDEGYPTGVGWQGIDVLTDLIEKSYALKIRGNVMMPPYRDGTLLLINPGEMVQAGDRVLFKRIKGNVIGGIVSQKNKFELEVLTFSSQSENLVIPIEQIEWLSKIIWASQ